MYHTTKSYLVHQKEIAKEIQENKNVDILFGYHSFDTTVIEILQQSCPSSLQNTELMNHLIQEMVEMDTVRKLGLICVDL